LSPPPRKFAATLKSCRRIFFRTVNRRIWKQALSVALVSTLLFNTAFAAPQTAENAAAMVKGWKQELRYWLYASGWESRLLAWQGRLTDKPGKTEPKPQETQEERNAKVVRVEISPGDVTAQAGEPVVFSAAAYDPHGAPVSGVKFTWSGNDEGRKRAMSVSPKGVFVSPVEGNYKVTVEGAGKRAHVKVTVVGDKQPPLHLRERQAIKPVSSRDLPQPAAPQKISSSPRRERVKRIARAIRAGVTKGLLAANSAPKPFASFAPASPGAPPAPVVQSGGDDPYGWNSSNYPTAADNGKERGDMPGRPEDGGAGSQNYQSSAPLVGLPGRGLDASLALTYNSRVWHKANSEITFDIDRDWPAPGWSLGFGKIVVMGASGGYMLIDGDGTRHGYTGAIQGTTYTWFTGYTTDGTFTDYTVSGGSAAGGRIPSWAQARLSNGTVIVYGAPGANAVYPTQITDAQGNYLTVTYKNNIGPHIDAVTDTLGRQIKFYYDSDNLLTAVTAPGLTGGTRTLVRLNYESRALGYNYISDPTPKVRNGSFWAIKAIYFPGTNTGYWFGDTSAASPSYSSYGMIIKTLEQRTMSFTGPDPSSTGPTGQGTISPGLMSREVVYNYPLTSTVGLTAEPTYTERREKWAGMPEGMPHLNATHQAAVTTYSVTEETGRRKTTVTRPDGTQYVQYAVVAPGSFNDGLLDSEKTCAAGTNCANDYNDLGLRSSQVTWALGAYNSPRPAQREVTERPGAPKRKTEFVYGASYNQLIEAVEYDDDGNIARRTKTQYENSANYINRHIFNLPKVVEVYAPDNTTRLARSEFNYDGATLADAPNATFHSGAYNPYDPGYEYCRWEWDSQLQDYVWTCSWVYEYDPATNYRGNVTSVTRYANAAAQSGAVTETRTYDKTGNLLAVSATGCCEQTKFVYTSGTNYAYPAERIRGSATDETKQVKTTATYHYNTGQVYQRRDADNLLSENEYYPETLRLKFEKRGNGAKAQHIYDDNQLLVMDLVYAADNDPRVPGDKLASRVDRWLDGVGRVRGEIAYGAGYVLDVVNTEYDALGRIWKQTQPYRYVNGQETKHWTTFTHDALDRVKTVTTPDSSVTERFYDADAPAPSVAVAGGKGRTVRVRDQWGRERWARTDWAGRLVEVVEPEANGNGTVATGGLRTEYQYDLLNNLTQTTQGAQTRTFKYDSLSRLVAQKLAERDATLDDSGGQGSTWSDVFKYDTRSNLTERFDARRVKTTFNYGGDPLNRLQSVSYDKSSAIDAGNILAAATVSYEYETVTVGGRKDITRLKKVTDGLGTEELKYDDADFRLTEIKRTFTAQSSFPLYTNYVYDTLDRVREVTYPAQYGQPSAPRKVAAFSYDIASRLTTLQYGGNSFASDIVYNPASQTTALRVGYNTAQQLSESYSYDAPTGLLVNQKVERAGASAATLLDLSYDYLRPNTTTDRTGQLTKMTNNLDASGNKNRQFEYDALARLKAAKVRCTPLCRSSLINSRGTLCVWRDVKN
jgi:YD repeat-containing protein